MSLYGCVVVFVFVCLSQIPTMYFLEMQSLYFPDMFGGYSEYQEPREVAKKLKKKKEVRREKKNGMEKFQSVITACYTAM